ncbi:MAG: asparagine synthase (glutamine-hydrolyzing) [Myxococcales bacterium]|nr:asparagine synthase (glutamine-hydrolyzing) [Myxococcales bacterium]
MCGIVAVYARSGGVSAQTLERGTAALHHRGPDGRGVWVAEHGRVGLGHARLSIIDLETGEQPIANEDGQLHLVVNGELYDHDRLRERLQAGGHRMATTSDSEIALHLYEDLGAQCLSELRGEFAFVLWDERSQVLMAARDRFGIKPLYYAEIGGTLYLASEAKALFAAGVPARWDEESVYQRLLFTTPIDRSLFADIRQVPPGHYLIATPGQTKLVRYWDFDYPHADAMEPMEAPEAVERVRDAVVEATRLRLRADVPVGCYLSGGIDSCTALGVASALRDEPVAAFTISFEEERLDEADMARAMAEHAGADFHCFSIPNQARADHFAAAVVHNETTIGANVVAKFLLSEKVRDLGYKVVLTGEGSDEIFGGYATFRRDKALHEPDPDAALDEAAGPAPPARRSEYVRRALEVAGPALEHVRRRVGFVPSWMLRGAITEARVLPLLADDFAAAHRDTRVLQLFLDGLDIEHQVAGRAPLNRSLYLWSKSRLPNVMLTGLGDRSEMAHSIEGRLPFLDHHLVELARQLPTDLKIRDDTEKYVLREAARPYVLPEVLTRRKHPFVAPSSMQGRFGELIEDTLRGPALDSLPFFDPDAVRGLLDRAAADERGWLRRLAGGVLMPILCLAVLQQHYAVEG